MKIEFGVQEYFNELKLMDAQYGQEIELYPWIYMLLQMAECRKKEILKEGYQGVSIRDVHKGEKKKDNELIKLLRQKKGFPDHVILECKYEEYKILGCVEIKKEDVNTSLNLKTGVYRVMPDLNNRLLIPEKCEIEYFFNINELKGIFPKKEVEIQINGKGNIEGVDDEIEEKIKENLNLRGWTCSKVECYRHNDPERSYKTEITLEENKKINDISRELTIEFSDTKGIKTCDCTIEESKWNNNTELQCENEMQILSHLEKFKKVLYTNGLEFYFLTLKNKKQITIEKLADLSAFYKRYLEHNEKYIELKDEAEKQWNDLIEGLTSIDWHQPPVTEIPSTQTNTQE